MSNVQEMERKLLDYWCLSRDMRALMDMGLPGEADRRSRKLKRLARGTAWPRLKALSGTAGNHSQALAG